MTDSFLRWFASYLHQDGSEVDKLLKDHTATGFLRMERRKQK
jgi:hypothetical protein